VHIQPEKSMVAYAVSTLGGQSGTAVCIGDKIIAIHVGGGKANEEFNVGRLISADLLQNL
jgi:V8-like Glu-specific endopeptidase